MSRDMFYLTSLNASFTKRMHLYAYILLNCIIMAQIYLVYVMFIDAQNRLLILLY